MQVVGLGAEVGAVLQDLHQHRFGEVGIGGQGGVVVGVLQLGIGEGGKVEHCSVAVVSIVARLGADPSDHDRAQEILKAGSVMAVDELPQVALIVPLEVVSGEGPTVEVAVRFGQGVSDQGAEVLSGGHHGLFAVVSIVRGQAAAKRAA